MPTTKPAATEEQTPGPLNATTQSADDPQVNPLVQPAGTTSYNGFVRPGDVGSDGKPAIGVKDWT